ncbi:zinc finger protein 541-like [Sinocyclocheilus anshuiensis]|uniref:zinc finger protein 541-like n=1 Tax=Sinocyclocheilus anshuiensis TaxID=1608454 RepID=UPI0007B876C4|nr:PREDICTED: zinc finger protein 541-like [Sinocyclocheilus anshuiensis]
MKFKEREDFRTSWHPLNNYHYTGSDHWTVQEIKVFKKALVDHDKDFQQIHNVLQTKSIAQCVEYYYNMKKLKKFKQCVRATNKKDEGGGNSAFRCSQEHQPEQINGNTGQKTTAAQSEVCARDVKSHSSPSVRIETISRWQWTSKDTGQSRRLK